MLLHEFRPYLYSLPSSSLRPVGWNTSHPHRDLPVNRFRPRTISLNPGSIRPTNTAYATGDYASSHGNLFEHGLKRSTHGASSARKFCPTKERRTSAYGYTSLAHQREQNPSTALPLFSTFHRLMPCEFQSVGEVIGFAKEVRSKRDETLQQLHDAISKLDAAWNQVRNGLGNARRQHESPNPCQQCESHSGMMS